jgi:hypothetical protein
MSCMPTRRGLTSATSLVTWLCHPIGTQSRCGTLPLCLLYGGFAPYGSLTEKLWDRYGSDAVHGRVLAAGIRDPDGGRTAGIAGERTAHQKPAGPQDGRAGMPMAAAIAHLRSVE